MALPGWYFGAGAVAQTVWNLRHGFELAADLGNAQGDGAAARQRSAGRVVQGSSEGGAVAYSSYCQSRSDRQQGHRGRYLGHQQPVGREQECHGRAAQARREHLRLADAIEPVEAPPGVPGSGDGSPIDLHVDRAGVGEHRGPENLWEEPLAAKSLGKGAELSWDFGAGRLVGDLGHPRGLELVDLIRDLRRGTRERQAEQ
jgi:hypothetical protein